MKSTIWNLSLALALVHITGTWRMIEPDIVAGGTNLWSFTFDKHRITVSNRCEFEDGAVLTAMASARARWQGNSMYVRSGNIDTKLGQDHICLVTVESGDNFVEQIEDHVLLTTGWGRKFELVPVFP